MKNLEIARNIVKNLKTIETEPPMTKSETEACKEELALFVEELFTKHQNLEIARDIIEKVTSTVMSLDMDQEGNFILIDPHSKKDITQIVTRFVLDVTLQQQFNEEYSGL